MTSQALHRTLAALALAAGLLAAAAGSPEPAPAGLVPARIEELAGRIEREEDHVEPLAVAEWVRARRPRLRIVDLRTAAEFDAGHLPTSENLSLPGLLALPFAADETVVLVSAGGGHAAQAWVLLAARGSGNFLSMSGGYDAWQREVLAPELPRDADAGAQVSFARVSELSRYFGGRPKVVDAVASSATSEHSRPAGSVALAPLPTSRIRRGGC
ncbi:MAG: rhodanese-like domain-containing protein [Thermoanaerobaculia bacterium]